MKIWLDDERDPCNPVIQSKFGAKGDEVWVKTSSHAIFLIKTEQVTHISFDHDLGGDDNGYIVAQEIERLAYEKLINRINWRVHSQNPVGRNRIRAAMKNADKYWS